MRNSGTVVSAENDLGRVSASWWPLGVAVGRGYRRYSCRWSRFSDEQAAAYGAFTSDPSPAEVERFFYLDDADRSLIARRRSDSHRLGFAVQLGTVRAVGRFLEDPLNVPWAAVEFLAEQLRIADASCVRKYVGRTQTPYEHAWEIRERFSYRSFDAAESAASFARFLDGRAWTHAEGPVALFEHAVGWLRRNQVLLPGVTVLARRLASARDSTEARLYEMLAAAAKRADERLPHRLAELLQVPDGTRFSALERLRQSPRRSSGPEMVKALQRAEQIAALGVGRVEVDDVPMNRLKVLARTGLGSKASALARLSEPKKTATLLAVVRHLEAAAVDDTLDLFALLMATRLLSPAWRASAEQRLSMLPRLERASKTVARASRMLLDSLAAAADLSDQVEVSALWPRSKLSHHDQSAMRAALVGRYNTVRPFLTLLGESSGSVPYTRTRTCRSERWTETPTWCACWKGCIGRWAAATCSLARHNAGPTRARNCWPMRGGRRYARTCWPG